MILSVCACCQSVRFKEMRLYLPVLYHGYNLIFLTNIDVQLHTILPVGLYCQSNDVFIACQCMLLVNYIEESAICPSVLLVKRANDGTICLKALQMCCNSWCVFFSCQFPFLRLLSIWDILFIIQILFLIPLLYTVSCFVSLTFCLSTGEHILMILLCFGTYPHLISILMP